MANKLEKKFWLLQAEEEWKRQVFERDDGLCVCGSPIEVFHHLLGRQKPGGWKGLPEEIRATWIIQEDVFNPHVEPNGRGLCLRHHVPLAHRFRPIMKKLLMIEILSQHEQRIWNGHTYDWWYHRDPFLEFLR